MDDVHQVSVSVDWTELNFLEIDECTESSHNCDVNATCIDTKDSFHCVCNAGYTGNGTYCQGRVPIIASVEIKGDRSSFLRQFFRLQEIGTFVEWNENCFLKPVFLYQNEITIIINNHNKNVGCTDLEHLFNFNYIS